MGGRGWGSCWKEPSTGLGPLHPLTAVGLCILALGASVSPSANACCKNSVDWRGGSSPEKSVAGSLIRAPWPDDPLPHPQANSSVPAADPASFLSESDEAQTTSSLDLLMACSPSSAQQKQGGWLPEAEHALFPRRLGLASVTSWTYRNKQPFFLLLQLCCSSRGPEGRPRLLTMPSPLYSLRGVGGTPHEPRLSWVQVKVCTTVYIGHLTPAQVQGHLFTR